MATNSWNLWQKQLRSPLGNLVEAGEILHSRGGMIRYRYLQRYALVLITRGEGFYEDDHQRSRHLTAGDWILVLPQLGHCYRPWETGGWDEVYIMFEGPVFDAWRDAGLLTANHVTGRVADPGKWAATLRQVMNDGNTTALEKLCAFQQLLAQALEGAILTPGEDEVVVSWFADACRMLSQPGAEAKQVASAVGVNYETFRRRFQKQAGLSPHQYHVRQIVNSAARMLDTTDLKSAEIARTLGFCDEAYFSRTFKQFTGRSPRAYRQHRG